MVDHTVRLSWGLVARVPMFAVVGLHRIGQQDPAVQRIIELGATVSQAMKGAACAANRLGGRLTGSDAYLAATDFSRWLRIPLDPFGHVHS
jgi:hypothetical protein